MTLDADTDGIKGHRKMESDTDSYDDLADISVWAEYRERWKVADRPTCLFCVALELDGRHDNGCPRRGGYN